MNVKNRKIIRKLGFKTLLASRKRNIIAIIAIAMTAMLFTSLFTVILSMNESQQAYTFRQIGGYNHGTFKDVTPDQIAAISAHPKVKAAGIRTIIGFIDSGVFSKKNAEISFMDENCTKWSYATPTTGRMPKSDKEITMDTTALQLLGVQPELGAAVTLTWTSVDQDDTSTDFSDIFTLVGWWEYDNICPVHYINVSEDYINEVQANQFASGHSSFRSDLNVMLASTLNIGGQMEQIDTDLGYTWDKRGSENNVRIGVNWGYTTSKISAGMDVQMLVGIVAFLILVILTGYLIIYNIFQISVTGDIQFYGLIKTIGVTPRQLKRIIRWQALLLCTIGIPLGLLLGYGIGILAVPLMINSMNMQGVAAQSTSLIIFLLAAVFSLFTVLLSCSHPGKLAAKVSPVEATRYTEKALERKKSKHTSGAKVWQMALANLGRNRLKTALVMISLALSVVLMNILVMFVGGFDMEKYLSQSICADFIVSSPDYFRYSIADEYISQDTITEIKSETITSLDGCGYALSGFTPQVWMNEDKWRMSMSHFVSENELEQLFSLRPQKDDLVQENTQIEGLDLPLLDKLTVVDGDLSLLSSSDERNIAVAVETDDYGNVSNTSSYPAVGEKITVTYVTDACYIDSRTGDDDTENTPDEYLQFKILESHDVTYTVCAQVIVPYSMGFRYSGLGYDLVLPIASLTADSGQSTTPLFYLFDTADESEELSAETYLSEQTSDNPNLMYESKANKRNEFNSFKSLFFTLGSFLCAVIGVIGILNFFNAIMTGILSRHREFAVLQAVGMTGHQLKKMLILEGMFYAMGSVLIALILSLTMEPIIGNLLEDMFWFVSAKNTVLPVVVIIPAFALLGWIVPSIMYGQSQKHSIVERLRENG